MSRKDTNMLADVDTNVKYPYLSSIYMPHVSSMILLLQ